MLPIQVKRILYNSVPSSVSVEDVNYSLQRTFGKAVLSTIVSPTVNISIVSDGKRYSRSIDDCTVVTDATVSSCDLRSAVIQYTVGASVQRLTASDTIKKTSSKLYTLSKLPVVDITSIGSYVKNTDYILHTDHQTIEWLTSGPAVDTNFTVNYSYIEDGYWIVSGIADYLMQEILSNLIKTLAAYEVNVEKVGDIVDLSAIYANDTLSVLSFDVYVTYPYRWARTTTEEDGFAIESIDVELYVNDNYIETIHAE